MPPVFGPSLIPDKTVYGGVEMVSISFRTSMDAAESLVPHYFQVRESPVVTVSRMTYTGVDYLGGRGYSEVTVGITAVHRGPDGDVAGSYMPVVWVDDGGALTVGRELLGYSKLLAVIPATQRGVDRCTFEAFEYGTRLLSGEVSMLRRLDEPALDRVRRAARTTTVLGWKYITGPGGIVDADYPTQITMNFEIDEGWTGEGRLDWETAGHAQAPFGSRIAAVMKALPVEQRRPAFVGRGTGSLSRAATRVLR
jgi:acetoacetate decarboxylase